MVSLMADTGARVTAAFVYFVLCMYSHRPDTSAGAAARQQGRGWGGSRACKWQGPLSGVASWLRSLHSKLGSLVASAPEELCSRAALDSLSRASCKQTTVTASLPPGNPGRTFQDDRGLKLLQARQVDAA